ncbi:MAG: 4Fe-4S dicluster domain-containing protein [Mariprofundus sp.]
MPSFSDCYGCSLCLLSCPMWLQRRDVRFSPQGYAKAMQHGADGSEMAETLSACIQCGACDLLCPAGIDLTGMINTALQQSDLANKQHDQPSTDWFAMSCDPALRHALREDDLYIIDAVAFHRHHARRALHYEKLRQATGCSMNLDLNRMAVATGIGSMAARLQSFDLRKQVEWLLQGRNVQRIIVENPADQAVLIAMTGKPVLHLSELTGSSAGHA